MVKLVRSNLAPDFPLFHGRDAGVRCVPAKLVSVSGDETKLQLHSVGALLPTKTLVTIVLCHISRDSE